MLCCCALVLMPGTAKAQDPTQFRPFTTAETVGFAFHKLGNLKPDFESWIKAKDSYIHSDSSTRVQILAAEGTRLQAGFDSYRPETGLVEIDLPGIVIKSPRADANGVHTVPLIFDKSVEQYFPVEVGGMWVALVPQDYDRFRMLKFSDARYNALKKFADFDKNGEAQVFARFTFRPKAVDLEQPMEADGMPVWPMLVETASLTLWTPKDEQFLWSYDAPWYRPASKRGLHKLHGQ